MGYDQMTKDQLYIEQGNKEAELDALVRLYDEIQDKKNKIIPYRDSVSDQELEFRKGPKRKGKELFKEKYEWKGSLFDRFDGEFQETLLQEDDDYKEDLDMMLDDINVEIETLNDELNDKLGLIGDLNEALENIATAIKNWLN